MTFHCDSHYLVMLTDPHASLKKLCFYQGEKLVYDLDIRLTARENGQPMYIDVERFCGSDLTLSVEPEMPVAFEKAQRIPVENLYGERFRPNCHFSPALGWMNDPNGLVYAEGWYHLFFQHNPADSAWGNMHWGHAVSQDMIHWQQRDDVLFPDETGTMFSGSAIVDEQNRTGLMTDPTHKPILLYYTAAGGNGKMSEGVPFTQRMAYSLDGGETFVKYPKAMIPHVEAENRDPKVVYDAAFDRYLIPIYLNDDRYAIFRSDNLLDWKLLQVLHLPGDNECPDLYPLPVDGDESNLKWVLYGAHDQYLTGRMEEAGFVAEAPVRSLYYGTNGYASQSYSGIPGRKVRHLWNTFNQPGMPFCCCQSLPHEMFLKTVKGVPTLCTRPAAEVESLRAADHTEAENGVQLPFAPWDIWVEGEGSLELYGMRIAFGGGKLQVNATVMPYTGSARIILDVTSVEIFSADDTAMACMGMLLDDQLTALVIGGGLKVSCAPLEKVFAPKEKRQ